MKDKTKLWGVVGTTVILLGLAMMPAVLNQTTATGSTQTDDQTDGISAEKETAIKQSQSVADSIDEDATLDFSRAVQKRYGEVTAIPVTGGSADVLIVDMDNGAVAKTATATKEETTEGYLINVSASDGRYAHLTYPEELEGVMNDGPDTGGIAMDMILNPESGSTSSSTGINMSCWWDHMLFWDHYIWGAIWPVVLPLIIASGIFFAGYCWEGDIGTLEGPTITVTNVSTVESNNDVTLNVYGEQGGSLLGSTQIPMEHSQ